MPLLPRFLLLAAAFLPALHASAPADASAAAARIARVENGLLPPARIAGTPAETWPIPARMAFHGVSGVSIALINHGEIEWTRAYSLGPANSAPITPNTPFEAAELADPIIAFAALSMAETGRLSLDRDLRAQLQSPGVPPTDEPVTPRALLSHTQRLSADDATRLRQLLAQIARQDFPTFMRDRVLQPFAMNASSFAPLPGGGLRATPGDLARFALALQRALTGQPGPVAPALAKKMLTRPRPGDDNGLGFELKGEGADYSFRCGGRNAGYCSLLVAYPRTGRGAVVMTDSGNGAELASEILRAIAREYAWPDYQVVEKAAVVLAPGAFDNFAGIYERDDAVLRIFREGGHFYLKPRGQPRLEMFARSDHEFFLLDGADTFSFERNAEGLVTHFIRRHPGGGPQVFRRID